MSPRISARQTTTLSLRPAHTRLLPRQVAWAQGEATRILDQARKRAEEIERQARERARQLLHRARQQGEQSGRRRYLEHMVRLDRRWRQSLAEARHQARLLAIEMTRRLLRRNLEIDPGLVEQIAQGVLEENPVGSGLEICTAPGDVPAARKLSTRLAARTGTPVTVTGDDNLHSGDVVVRGSWGEVDARLETQLAALARLLERWRQEDD